MLEEIAEICVKESYLSERQRQEHVWYKGVEYLELRYSCYNVCVGCILVISVVSCVKTTL